MYVAVAKVIVGKKATIIANICRSTSNARILATYIA